MNTRLRITIAAVVVPVAFLAINLINPDIPEFQQNKSVLIPLIIAALQAILVAWVVEFKLKGERIFTVLAYPAVSIGVLLAFVDIVIRTSGNTLDRLSTLVVSALVLCVVTYILTSTMNILNLASIQSIPLGQAGRAAHYVLTLIFSYFSFVLIINYEISVVIKYLAVFGVVFVYTFSALWTIALAYSQRFNSSLAIALLVTFVYMVLSVWPLDSFYLALFMVLVYYMSLGVALEVREIIGRWIWYEYTAIFIVILLLMLTTASWGVNGTIF